MPKRIISSIFFLFWLWPDSYNSTLLLMVGFGYIFGYFYATFPLHAGMFWDLFLMPLYMYQYIFSQWFNLHPWYQLNGNPNDYSIFISRSDPSQMLQVLHIKLSTRPYHNWKEIISQLTVISSPFCSPDYNPVALLRWWQLTGPRIVKNLHQLQTLQPTQRQQILSIPLLKSLSNTSIISSPFIALLPLS